MDEVIEAISKPLTDDETVAVNFDRSTPRLLEPDTEDNLNELFLQKNWNRNLHK